MARKKKETPPVDPLTPEPEKRQTEEPVVEAKSLIKKALNYFVTDEAIHHEDEVKKEAPGLWRSLFNAEPDEESGDKGGFSFSKIGKRYKRYQETSSVQEMTYNVYQEVEISARPSPEYWILVFFSCVIAALGLLQNSAAVIIGAMIIAPLMSPIMGLSMGTVWGQIQLVGRSARVVGLSVGFSIGISAVMGFFSPIGDLSAEILSRTQPNLYDLGIALACGLIGAYTLCTARLSSALPGVAISVALMPPLCSVGICIGKGQIVEAGGALVLFTTNLLGISLSACLVFWYKQVFPKSHSADEVKDRVTRQIKVTLVLMCFTTAPLAYFSYLTYQTWYERTATEERVKELVPSPFLHSYSIEETKGDEAGRTLQVQLFTGLQLTNEQWRDLKQELERIWHEPFQIQVRVLRSEFMAF